MKYIKSNITSESRIVFHRKILTHAIYYFSVKSCWKTFSKYTRQRQLNFCIVAERKKSKIDSPSWSHFVDVREDVAAASVLVQKEKLSPESGSLADDWVRLPRPGPSISARLTPSPEPEDSVEWLPSVKWNRWNGRLSWQEISIRIGIIMLIHVKRETERKRLWL